MVRSTRVPQQPCPSPASSCSHHRMAFDYGMQSTMDVIHPHGDHGRYPYSMPLESAVCSARSANIRTVRFQQAYFTVVWLSELSRPYNYRHARAQTWPMGAHPGDALWSVALLKLATPLGPKRRLSVLCPSQQKWGSDCDLASSLPQRSTTGRQACLAGP
jgi:hypothetical protein